jgi:hypothetical protein
MLPNWRSLEAPLALVLIALLVLIEYIEKMELTSGHHDNSSKHTGVQSTQGSQSNISKINVLERNIHYKMMATAR